MDGSPLFILVNWDYEKEARGYELEIAKTHDMKKRVLRKKGITKKRAVINKQLSPGTYYLRVRARHDNPAEERWSRPEVFQVFDRQSQAPTSGDDS